VSQDFTKMDKGGELLIRLPGLSNAM